MKNILVASVATLAQFALATTVFAGTVAPAQRAQTAAATPSFAASSLAGFTQNKGGRPASAVAGAVSIKLFSEYAHSAPGQSTAIQNDAAGFSGLVGAQTPIVAGMVGQKTNSMLLTGLVAAPRK